MPELGVSEFSAVFVTTGKPKHTKIRNIATRGPYQFYQDYYLSLRTAIRSLFTQKRHISSLYEVCRRQKGESKKINYEKVVNIFKDWQSGKNISAYTPPKGFYFHSATSINCNPELNVVLNGQPRLVKLHFNFSEKMTQERANIICALIEEVIDDAGFEYSVLDLTSGREFFFNGEYEQTIQMINDEIRDIEKIWSDYV